MTKEDLLRKVRVHVEVTEDCVMNTNLDKHTEELLKQDNDLFKEVISFLADEKVKVIIDQANVSGSLLETRNCLICGYFCNNEHHSNNWYDTNKQ